MDIAIKHSFDYLTLPSVMTGRDLQEIRLNLGPDAEHMQVIAKIDSLDAVQNFNSILKHADGIIILRDELLMELEPEKLVLAQKWMTQTANTASVPVFLQSQVLESMINNDVTNIRSQTQDISNHVMEGADVFILSHETSVG